MHSFPQLGRTWLVPFVAAVLLGGCATTGSNSPISAADEALYMERFAAQAAAAIEGGGLPAYDPLVSVVGASEVNSFTLKSGRISQAALAEAASYSAARNSSALLVWHEGKLVHETYFGDTNGDTLINSKSLAKPLTAIMVGRAIAEGHIESLDQPVSDFITEWRGTPKAAIQVRHLLDMRSGLLPQGFSTEPENVLNRAYLHPRHIDVIIHEYPLVNEPGSRYEYANANSELVAELIERATGMRYDTFISAALLEPIGAAGGTVWINREGGEPHAGCCIQLPAQTYLRFAQLLLGDGIWDGRRLLPEGYVDAMRTPTVENPHAGLGVFVAGDYVRGRGSLNPEMELSKTLHSEPYAASDLFLFDGNGHQVVYIVPSQDLIVLRTGSYPGGDLVWDNAYLPNAIIRGIERRVGEAAPTPQAGG